jgi:Fe-S oxidoreductase/nitrate reductase gamma subunit
MYLLLGFAIILFLAGLYRCFKPLLGATMEKRFDRLPVRICSLFFFVLLQVRLFIEPLAGVMHALIFWGFCIFFAGYIHLFILGREIDFAPYQFFQDIFGGFVIVAVFLALVRRFVFKIPRLMPSLDAAVILILILFIMLGFFVCETSALAFKGERSPWIPLGSLFSKSMEDLPKGDLKILFMIAWWVHLVLILVFLVYLPHSKHLHIISSLPNVFFRDLNPMGKIEPIDLESSETFGASRFQELSWKDLLDLLTCTECGRCQLRCPSVLSEKPLSPRDMIVKMRDGLRRKEPKPLPGGIVPEEEIWCCTNCGYCQRICPLFIEQLPKILKLRQALVLMESRFPQELKLYFKNLESSANPWGLSPQSRHEWAEGLQLKPSQDHGKLLLWVGCFGAYDERVKLLTRRFAGLLKSAGLDFETLGNQEHCCGESARRMGNEYLFQILAQENVENLKKIAPQRIVTFCPHCYNTLKNDYPSFGLSSNVLHHTELLFELLKKGLLKPPKLSTKRLSYQDPCFLARYNGIYTPPREILRLSGGNLLEAKSSRQKALCCGGGGGRMWMEEKVGRRINQLRFRELLEVNPDLIVTACPFCLTMFEDAKKELEEAPKVLDLCETFSGS